MATPADRDNTPEMPSPHIAAMQPELKFVRDVEEGWPHVASVFLTQFAAEHPKDFRARQARPTWEDFFNPTVDGAVGRIFAREPQLQGGGPRAQDLWDNIDGRGNRGNVFLYNLSRDGLIAGQSVIVVDFPSQLEQPASSLGARRAQQRAYWIPVCLDDVTHADIEWRDGTAYLVLFAYYHPIEERTGFKVKKIDEWRVLRHNLDTEEMTAEVWRRQKDAGLKSAPNGDMPVLFSGPVPIVGPEALPVVSMNFNAEGDYCSRPPFLALAQLCVNFYLTTSDMHRAHELTSYPMIFGKGIPDKNADGEPLAIGPGTAVLTEKVDAELSYVAGDGKGVELGLKLRETIRSGMGVAGLSFLEQDTRQAQTATAKSLDQQVDDDRIRSWSEILQDAVNQAWVFTAAFEALDSVPTLEFAPPPEPLAGTAPNMQAAADGTTVATGNPYRVVAHGSEFCVEKIATGETVKCHPDKASAMAHFRALEAATAGERP